MNATWYYTPYGFGTILQRDEEGRKESITHYMPQVTGHRHLKHKQIFTNGRKKGGIEKSVLSFKRRNGRIGHCLR